MLTEYETIPTKIKAFQAPVKMSIPTLRDTLDVDDGDWVVYDLEGNLIEVLDFKEFNAKYRLPEPYPKTFTVPCYRPHSDFGYQGPNQNPFGGTAIWPPSVRA